MTNNKIQGSRVARVATTPFLIRTQLYSHLEALYQAGGQVTVISSQGEHSRELDHLHYCSFEPIFIAREISFFADVKTLFKLWRFFRSQRFDIVHSITPKAGLLCAIAAWGAGTSIRLHTYTGQPWIMMSGLKKWIVKYSDVLIALLNTQCYTDSFSQRDFLVTNKIMPKGKIKVLGRGSLAGIDLERFCQDYFSVGKKDEIRKTLNLNRDTGVILFLGRVTEDKGVYELLEAFSLLILDSPDLVLLIVGPLEGKVEKDLQLRAVELCGNKVVFTGFNSEPEYFIAISDILCIPSYREGFGTVVIEAAAMGVPSVGTKIYGLTDAIVDGETGLLVEPKNVIELTQALRKLIDDEPLRKRLGENAKQRALKEFDSKHCGELLVREYEELLK